MDILQKLDYPGRIVLLGIDGESIAHVYAVTARNSASKAKRYVLDSKNNKVTVEPTDVEVMSQGNLDLLQYNCTSWNNTSVVIGNGRQVNSVNPDAEQIIAKEVLAADLEAWEYEPDKHKTPRITGMSVIDSAKVSLALSIIRSDSNNKSINALYELNLKESEGKMISTYNGPNIKPTPSFEGDPKDFNFKFGNAKNAAESIYNDLAPSPGEDDLRVSVVALYRDIHTKEDELYIINTVDLYK